MCAALDGCHGVTRVKNIVVQLDDLPWPFATQNSGNISSFWQEKKRKHPHFFDGQVHVMTSWEIRGDQTSGADFIGNMCRTNFASFLYWKMSDAHSHNEVDFSGGAVVLCSDGALLMALTGDHTIAPATLEFPSGFVDVSDFDDNKLNFDRHVEREVVEELVISKDELDGPKSIWSRWPMVLCKLSQYLPWIPMAMNLRRGGAVEPDLYVRKSPTLFQSIAPAS